MAKIENTMECLDVLIDKMLEKGLSKLSYSDGDFELKLEAATVANYCAGQQAAMAAGPGTTVVGAADGPTSLFVAELKGHVVKSPIVGTYYNAPAPDKEPFVTAGQKVKKGDVLMIIESMKLMNEIACDCDGTVAEIMLTTGTPVEFDQPIMRIE